jgi:iron complex transport system substrate-binding protein
VVRLAGAALRGSLALATGLLLVAAGEGADTRPITDSAGRRVEVPRRVERVYAAGGPASILLYTLAPERMLGWNRPLTPEERPFVPARYADLPALGRLTGRGNTANVETVLAAGPDVIIDYGVLTATYVSLADRIQQQAGVPYLLFDGGLSAIPAVYTMLGELLGVAERGRELARRAARLLAETDRRVAAVPVAKRPAVYYARGPKGLETAARGSINVESIERLGARNVAESLGRGGVAAASPEQVLAWDPEIVIAMDPAFVAGVRTDPVWRTVRAVREGRVYLVPQAPFPWVDFPPSVNRLIGLKWLGRIFYPEQFPEDLRQETRAFYTLFYHRAPTEAQLDVLLAGLERARP